MMLRVPRPLLAFAVAALAAFGGLSSGMVALGCANRGPSKVAGADDDRVFHYTPTVQSVDKVPGDGAHAERVRVVYTRTYGDLATAHRATVDSTGKVLTIVLDTLSVRPGHPRDTVSPDAMVIDPIESGAGLPIAPSTVVIVDRHGIELFRSVLA
jgi:hypothetical protein